MDRIKKQILSILSSGSISIWRIIDFQDASLPEFFKKIIELEKDDIIKVSDGVVRLTNKGQKIAKKFVFGNYKCKLCNGTGYKMAYNIKKKYKSIIRNRPKPIEKYDQGYVGMDAILRKLAFMIERGDVYGKIFVAGDDDLFSIALALTGLPEKVVAVDIDERLTNFINNIAKKYRLNVEAYIQDFQHEIKDFHRKFDVFVTDPVETLPGIKLFLSRAVASLKGKGCAGYFGLTTLEASRKKWFEIQKMIHDMGFVITDIRRQFQVYPDDGNNFFQFQDKLPIVKKLGTKSDYNWYKSALYRIEAIKKPVPLIKGDIKLGKAIYKDGESWATPI